MLPGLLSDKTVLVTGAASGIGCKVAELCAIGGARVILCDLDREKLAQVAVALPDGDRDHQTHVCDITDSAAVRQVFEGYSASGARIHAVANCAGIWRPDADRNVDTLEDAIWDQIIAVNLSGTLKVCREAVRHMESHGGGSIVTVASIVALAGWDKLNAYSASKGGVLALSRSLAVECGKKSIRVNCVCPGVTATPMTEDVLKYSQPTILPLGRIGRPEDSANMIALLCSDYTSFMTGATVAVDGGFSAA